MSLQPETFKTLVKVAAEQVIASAPELTSLDQAIGDGDHGTNMKRGFEAVLNTLDTISSKPLDEALKAIGKTLVMTVGGASGPLYGSFFLAAGEALSHSKQLPDDLAEVFGSGVNAVSTRGRSQAGEKTMLDVLVPVHEILAQGGDVASIKDRAARAAEATIPIKATRGRASFLGERSVGHMDPGARSSSLMIAALCDEFGES